MKVQVTQKHIDAGIIGSSSCCPIAKAIRQKLKTKKLVSVTSTNALVGTKYYFFPMKIVKKIVAFDAGRKIKPFNFDLISE